ncbi:hypothetical protein BVRB_3g056100 [Beta vulgaris subsp. vulgaris]|nr:hypothetical protein BVRB_3g056100 [Beta vulgaris subsp. vulgaris]
MEAMRMRAAFAIVMMIIAIFSFQNVAAVDAPAPAPTSDAAAFFPAALTSLIALAFGLLY